MIKMDILMDILMMMMMKTILLFCSAVAVY